MSKELFLKLIKNPNTPQEEIKAIFPQAVEEILKENNVDVNAVYNGRSLLLRAIQLGDVESVKLLLGTGKVTIDEPRNYLGQTPLHVAVDKKYELHEQATDKQDEIIQLLLQYKANPILKDNSNESAFDLSIYKYDWKLATTLIDHMPEPSIGINAGDQRGESALQRMLSTNIGTKVETQEYYDFVEFLVNKGAKLDHMLEDNNSPLH